MRIIIIGGAQRSGTTLVQTLVANALPDAPLLPEAHILCGILNLRRRTKSGWTKASLFYEGQHDALEFFRTTVAAHIRDIQKRYPNAENLVLKDPGFAEVLPEIIELLPDAVTIVCIRDPRDIVASFIKIGLREADRKQPTPYGRRDIRYICNKINGSYRTLLAGKAPSGLVLVRYEDVVTDSAGALHRLANESGLPLQPGRLNSVVWLDDEYRHKDTWRTELEGGPPVARSIGNFRRLLGRDERARVERFCRPIIENFSYVIEGEEWAVPTILEQARILVGRIRGKHDA